MAVIGGALIEGHIQTSDRQAAWLVTDPASPPDVAGRLRVLAKGHCVFHHRGGEMAAGCAVHAAVGHGALPSSCQHFPRLCLIDARGVHVTLSHYCPTAAGLLFDADDPATIVEGPDAVPGWDVPEGLDARDVLPPALTPQVLMDQEGYTAWEQHMIASLAGARPRGRTIDEAVGLLVSDAATLARWRPGRQTLAEAVGALDASVAEPGGTRARMALFEEARAACHEPWTWPEAPATLDRLDARLVAPVWPAFDAVLRRYLASHAFGAWAAYQGRTMAAVVKGIGRALAVVRVEAVRVADVAGRPLDRGGMTEAIRQADLLLRHYADHRRLA